MLITWGTIFERSAASGENLGDMGVSLQNSANRSRTVHMPLLTAAQNCTLRPTLQLQEHTLNPNAEVGDGNQAPGGGPLYATAVTLNPAYGVFQLACSLRPRTSLALCVRVCVCVCVCVCCRHTKHSAFSPQPL